MFKIVTSADTYRYKDDVKFDNALSGLRAILSRGFEAQHIPVNQLVTKIKNTDDVLEFSDAELFMIRACVDAVSIQGGGEEGLRAFWAAIIAGKPLDANHPVASQPSA